MVEYLNSVNRKLVGGLQTVWNKIRCLSNVVLNKGWATTYLKNISIA